MKRKWLIIFVHGLLLIQICLVMSTTSHANTQTSQQYITNLNTSRTLLENGNYVHARILLEHNRETSPKTPFYTKQIADLDYLWARHVEVTYNHTIATPFYRRAAEEFRKALELYSEKDKEQLIDSVLQEIYVNLARTQIMLREYDEAINILTGFIAKQPNHPDANHWLGVALRRKLDEAENVTLFERDDKIFEMDMHFSKALRYITDDSIVPFAYIFVGLLDYQAGVKHLAKERLARGIQQLEQLVAMESIGQPKFTEFERKYYEEAKRVLNQIQD